MITIDGSQHSGSGTIVRYAVALAALLHEPVRIIKVREHRAQRGLRTQHVESVLACAALCGATTEGVHVAVQHRGQHISICASNGPGTCLAVQK